MISGLLTPGVDVDLVRIFFQRLSFSLTLSVVKLSLKQHFLGASLQVPSVFHDGSSITEIFLCVSQVLFFEYFVRDFFEIVIVSPENKPPPPPRKNLRHKYPSNYKASRI